MRGKNLSKQYRYFEKIKKLLEQTSPKLAATYRLEFKNVFGAAGGYVNGRIFISCGEFGVALRLPPEILGNLFKERGVKQLKYFLNGHVKKEYAVIPERILQNKRQMKKIVDESVEYVIV